MPGILRPRERSRPSAGFPSSQRVLARPTADAGASGVYDGRGQTDILFREDPGLPAGG